jgi:hypothetical protein
MRTHFLASLVLASATTAIGAQFSSTPPPSSPTTVPKQAEKTMTLLGCVQGDDASADSFTLSDKKAGPSYRLSGTDVRAYVGRRVRIVGGLVPSPNIAAQASAIDPAIAAMATAGRNLAGTGNAQPLEFRVARVRPVTSSCPSQSSPEPASGTTKGDGRCVCEGWFY